MSEILRGRRPLKAGRGIARSGEDAERGDKPMEEKVVITLRASELVELERILIDRDKDEALRFLKDCVQKKADEARSGRIKQHLA